MTMMTMTKTTTKNAKVDEAVKVILAEVKGFLDEHKLDSDLWTKERAEKLVKKLKMKRERDPDVPKRPLSGFFRFQDELRKQPGIKDQFPQSAELAKEASRLWHLLSLEDKAEYEEAYQADLKIYKENKGETHHSDSDSHSSHSGEGCQHIFPRGGQKGEKCGVVGCKKHNKTSQGKPSVNKPESEESEEAEEAEGCQHIFPRGGKKGEKCGVVGCKKHNKTTQGKPVNPSVPEKVEEEDLEVKEEEEDLEEEKEEVKEEEEDLEEVEEETCVYVYPEGHNHEGEQCGRECEEGVYCKRHSGVMAVKENVEREEREEKTKSKVKEVVCRHKFAKGANKGGICGKVNCKLHE
jgi:hypothetical protein